MLKSLGAGPGGPSFPGCTAWGQLRFLTQIWTHTQPSVLGRWEVAGPLADFSSSLLYSIQTQPGLRERKRHQVQNRVQCGQK